MQLRCIYPYKAYLRERITAYPQLSGRHLLREVRDLGYDGGYTAITDFLRTVRPPTTLPRSTTEKQKPRSDDEHWRWQ